MADNSAFEAELAKYLKNTNKIGCLEADYKINTKNNPFYRLMIYKNNTKGLTTDGKTDGKTPAINNKFYRLMIYTNIHSDFYGSNAKEDLIWNRFFYADLNDDKKREIGLFSDKEKNIVYNFKPLTAQERELLKYFMQDVYEIQPEEMLSHNFSNCYYAKHMGTFNVNNFIFYNANFSNSIFFDYVRHLIL